MTENSDTINVVSAIADKKQVILYLDTGKQIIIKQGDHRLSDLMDAIIPITTKGEVAVISLKTFSVYKAFEEKSNTKFFKMAKKLIGGFFGTKNEPTEINLSEETKNALKDALNTNTVDVSHEDVETHGVQITDDTEISEDHTVVAVVTHTDTKKKTIISGVDKIKPIISNAIRNNSVEAVEKFLQRCAGMMEKRKHSVEDLIRFLEKGDLPIADDGSIIAYKMLRYKINTPGNEIFLDCHTGKIEQRVGSYVSVHEDLVDLNRNNECSNGLHIARRDYLSSFSGDVCVLCKIDPEDVITVPHGDPRKVRVKGYHIINILSQEAYTFVKSNKAITNDNSSLTMVYNAIKGNHIARIENVEVRGQLGTNVVTTKLLDNTNKIDKKNISTKELDKAKAIDDDDIAQSDPVSPREINKRVNKELVANRAKNEKEKSEPKKPKPKKETKTPVKTVSKALSKPVAVVKSVDTKKKPKAVPAAPVKASKPKPAKVVKPVEPEVHIDAMSLNDRAMYYYRMAIKHPKSNNLKSLMDLKRKAKKSWSGLGFSSLDIKDIESLTHSL